MVTVEEAAATFARRNAVVSEADRLAEVAARERLPALAELLRKNGARAVILFGSLAEGRFHQASDIDLAVEGMHWRVALRMMSHCSELARRHVDVVCLEDAPPSLVERIRQAGQPLP